MTTLTGHCLCGGVTLRVVGPVVRASHCHCESCRRTTSAPVASFFTVRRSDAVLAGESLSFHASSPGVQRGFCGRCGSPMSYESAARPEEIDLYLACLEATPGIAPAVHYYWSERVPWLNVVDDLPKED